MGVLRDFVIINPRVNFSNMDDETEVSFVPMECIDTKFGKIDHYYKKNLFESKGFTKFREGDFLWAKITPCMQNAKSAIAKNLVNGYGFGSTEFYVLRPKSKNIKTEYIHFILRDPRILKNAEKFFGGSAGQQRVSKDFLLYLPIPIPPLDVQNKIIALVEYAYSKSQNMEKKADELFESIDEYLLSKLKIKVTEFDDSALEERIFPVESVKVIGGRFDPKKYSKKYQYLFSAIENATFDKVRLRDIVISSISGNWGVDESFEDESLIKCLTIRGTEFDNRYNLLLDNNRAKYRKYPPELFDKIKLRSNDILIEKSGGSENQPVGRVAFIDNELAEESLAYSNFLQKIRINEEIAIPEYVFEYLKLMHNIKVTEVMQTQTNGIRNLILKEYFNQTIILPDKDIQKEIVAHIRDIRKQAKRLEEEAENIVKDAKKQVEEILLGDVL